MPLLTGAVAQHYVSSREVSAQRAAMASLSSARLTSGPTTTHVSALRTTPDLDLESIGRSETRGLGAPPSAASKRAIEARPRMAARPRPPAEVRAPSVLFGATHAAFNGSLAVFTPPAPMLFGVTRAAFNGALPGLAALEPAARAELAPSALPAAISGSATQATSEPSGAVMDVKTILHALRSRRSSVSDAAIQALPKDGTLELEALHLGETVNVRPFDDQLQPVPEAMSAIDHVMRCRITGTVIPIDPRLIEILVQLHTLYGKPIELVSGHRQPLTIGTKKTSQHALGRAADIRIPGVGIEELKRVAMKLGARGIGLYPEKGFVHIDVRQKPRYFWSYTAAGGELGDGRAPARPPMAATVAAVATDEPSVETHAEPESGEDTESTSDTAAAEPHQDDPL
jgi:uncharacterized protein YcbK (DUF882 family)